jgi:hypothetical protein
MVGETLTPMVRRVAPRWHGLATVVCPNCRSLQVATAPKTCCELCGHVWLVVKQRTDALEGIENGC